MMNDRHDRILCIAAKVMCAVAFAAAFRGGNIETGTFGRGMSRCGRSNPF